MADLAKLVVRLEAETSKYVQELDKANKKLSKFAKDQENVFSSIQKTLIEFFAAKEIIEFGARIVENADHLGKLSQAAGVSVESLSKLQYGARQSGVDVEGLALGLKKLNESISNAAGNAKSDAAVAFKAMGVSLTDATGRTRSADSVLSDVADRFSGYADGANKSALAAQLFGKEGDKLIPLLNQGSAGLKKFGDEAQNAGQVISGEMAEAADKFSSKLTELKLTLIDGIGNQIAADLLPNLNALADYWKQDQERAETFAAAAHLLADALRAIITVGIAVVDVFQNVGQAIYSINVAVEDALTGNFDLAREELEDGFAKIRDNMSRDMDKVAALWEDKGQQVADAVKDSADKVRKEAPNIAGAKEIQDAATQATKKLQELKNSILEQVATFGQGEAAATKYRLEFGNLADEVKKAGDAGKKFKDEIIQAANFKQAQADTKALGDAFAEVNAQLSELSGDSVGAALIRFDKQNEELRKTIARNGTDLDTKRLDSLRGLIEAQAQYNQLQEQAQRIQDDLAIKEEQIKNSRESGAITELDSLKQLDEARTKASGQLDEIYATQKKIADESGNPQLIENVKKFGAEIENLRAQTGLLEKQIRSGFEDSFVDAYTDVVTGAKSAKDALFDFFKSIEEQLVRLAAQNLAQSLFGSNQQGTGGGGGGYLGSIVSAISGAFAGGYADGGTIPAGKWAVVGENGPELAYAGRDTTIVPNGALGGGQTVVQHFSIQAPQGTVSKATQMQVGAQAARALQQANKRNN